MLVYNSKRQSIWLEDQPFAKGGEGSAFRITSGPYSDCCVKILHEDKRVNRLDKLAYMINHPLINTPDDQAKICWPIDFVNDGNKIIGFIMPMASPESISLYDLCTSKDNYPIFSRKEEKGIINRLKLLYNIAYAVNKIHNSNENSYVIVDFKPQNVLFLHTGSIYLIDMDSVQISQKGKVLYPATALTPEYAYPNELHNFINQKKITNDWDIFSYSIVAYQVLMGIHPFMATSNALDKKGNNITGLTEMMSNNLFVYGKRSDKIIVRPKIHQRFLSLPESLQNLFKKSFDLGDKPVPLTEWGKTLYSIIDSAEKGARLVNIKPTTEKGSAESKHKEEQPYGKNPKKDKNCCCSTFFIVFLFLFILFCIFLLIIISYDYFR